MERTWAAAGMTLRDGHARMLPLSARTAAGGGAAHSSQVVILGGGISGISLARSLVLDHNITDIVLVEARDELGGRAYTETLVNNATGEVTTVEKGCNWIQGPGKEPILELAAKWGLQTARTNYSDSAWWWEHFQDEGEQAAFREGYDAFLDNAPGYSAWREDNSLVDLSVRVATSIMDWIPQTPLQHAYEYWNIDFTFAQPPKDSSFANAFGQETGIENEIDDFVIDQRGYKHIFVQEARQIFGEDLDDERLHLGTTVTDIDYSSGQDIVVTTDKGTFRAPHVVSTFSVGVLQHQDVHFHPRLPDWKKEAIFTFAMATYQKIFLLYDHKFWNDEQFIMYADKERGRYTVWQNVNAFFPANTTAQVIMVTAIDAFARRNEDEDDATIQAEAVDVLRKMYGADVPEPLDIVIPRWHSDPLFRGSYSNWPLGVLDEHHSNLGQPVVLGEARLHFAGEATSYEMFGYVNGAWDSGLRTAAAIAECVHGPKCPDAPVYETLKTCEQVAEALEVELEQEQPQRQQQQRGLRRNTSGGARARLGARPPRRHHRGPRGK